MQQQFVVTHRYTVLQDKETPWPSPSRLTLSFFLRKYEKQFFYGHNIFTDDVFVTQPSSNAGFSALWTARFRTNCCFMSDTRFFFIINIQGWAIWPVPSPELQLLSPSILRSPNCSLSLWVVEVWFQGDSVLWHSLYVCEPVPSVFIYLV